MARILIIEDNKENLHLMSYLLSNHGHTPVLATDGEQGLLLCHKENFDLILCDIQLPKIDGFEIIRRLKAKNNPLREIPIVAITAYAMVGDREKILMAGSNGYIAKPIQPELFVSQIELYLSTDKCIQNPDIEKVYYNEEIEEQAPFDTHRGTVLVVDDSPTDRYLSEMLLSSIGFRIILASDVNEALEKLDQEIPDLIISDFHLPDQNGLDFLNMIKANIAYKNIPFIMISSSLPPEKRDDILVNTTFVEEVIIRPIEPQLFIEIIEKIWNKSTNINHISLL